MFYSHNATRFHTYSKWLLWHMHIESYWHTHNLTPGSHWICMDPELIRWHMDQLICMDLGTATSSSMSGWFALSNFVIKAMRSSASASSVTLRQCFGLLGEHVDNHDVSCILSSWVELRSSKSSSINDPSFSAHFPLLLIFLFVPFSGTWSLSFSVLSDSMTSCPTRNCSCVTGVHWRQNSYDVFRYLPTPKW